MKVNFQKSIINLSTTLFLKVYNNKELQFLVLTSKIDYL